MKREYFKSRKHFLVMKTMPYFKMRHRQSMAGSVLLMNGENIKRSLDM